MWTVQEAILPPKITVIVGWFQIAWSTLVAAAHSFFRHHALKCCSVPSETLGVLQTFYQKVDSIQRVRMDYHQGMQLDLPVLLHEFRNRSSTDPRDKIFALLGLVMRDPKYHALRADYTLSAEEVYKKAFISLLQATGNLNLLVRQLEVGRTLDLPTWIPDWTAKVDQLKADLHDYLRRNLHVYNTSCSTQPDIRWPDITTTLGVKGLLFDEIATLAEPDPNPHAITDSYIAYLKTLFNSTGRQSQLYIGGGDFSHAFWRLIIMDMILVYSDDSVRGWPQRSTLEDYRKYTDTLSPAKKSNQLLLMLPGFRFFITKMGYIGLGPENMRIGDTVHVFQGGSVPFVLRQATQQTVFSRRETGYQYVGNCYVQGIMDGEALQGVDLSELDWVNLV